MYQVLYRKWRPKTFDDVCGQEHITTTLKNEIKENRINHAYLFTGSRGTGKTTCAKILAKAVNCTHSTDGNPCGECEICRGIENGSILDVVEMDAASNRGIDDIRDIISKVQLSPERCKYRVYIIDEVHMLSTEAFNALLKTLEEPPEHVIFILATTEIHKVLPTIQSRCQRFDFNRISPRTIADRLLYVAQQEELELTDSAAMLIASVSDGAMRDALSLLDRCMAIGTHIDEKIVADAAGLADKTYLYELAACIINKNTAKSLEIISRLYSQSKDMARLCDELISHFRALMLIKSVREPRNMLIMSDSDFEKAQTQADYLSLADIVYYMDVLSRAFQRMGNGTGDRCELEMALVKLSSPELDGTTEALTARITALENAVKRGFASSPAVQVETDKTDVADETEDKATQIGKAKNEVSNQVIETENNKISEPDLSSNQPPVSSEAAMPKVPITKPAPVIETPRPTKSVNIDEIYSNAKPFPKWVEVVNNLKPFSRAIAAAFTGSTAYESGNYLLIDTNNEIAFDLLKNSGRRDEIRKIIQETTGKVYKLGPYKRPQKKDEQQDKLKNFKYIIKDSGIELVEE